MVDFLMSFLYELLIPSSPWVNTVMNVILCSLSCYLTFKYFGQEEEETSSPSSPRGLSPDELDLLPWFEYGTENGNGNGTGCAICFDDFRKGEKCRALPICTHLFHAECVDRWLVSKPTCPICRIAFELGVTLDVV